MIPNTIAPAIRDSVNPAHGPSASEAGGRLVVIDFPGSIIVLQEALPSRIRAAGQARRARGVDCHARHALYGVCLQAGKRCVRDSAKLERHRLLAKTLSAEEI